jgi:hypothetical protein
MGVSLLLGVDPLLSRIPLSSVLAFCLCRLICSSLCSPISLATAVPNLKVLVFPALGRASALRWGNSVYLIHPAAQSGLRECTPSQFWFVSPRHISEFSFSFRVDSSTARFLRSSLCRTSTCSLVVLSLLPGSTILISFFPRHGF